MGQMFQQNLTNFLSKEAKKRGVRVRDVALHFLPASLKITII